MKPLEPEEIKEKTKKPQRVQSMNVMATNHLKKVKDFYKRKPDIITIKQKRLQMIRLKPGLISIAREGENDCYYKLYSDEALGLDKLS